MKRNYSIIEFKRNEFDKLPKITKHNITEFRKVKSEIDDIEKTIKNHQNKIDKLKKGLTREKKIRTKLFNELQDYHVDFNPKITPYQSSTNFQWNVNLQLKGKTKTIYLGTDNIVRDKLNELKNTKVFTNTNVDDLRDEIKSIVTPHIITELRMGVDKFLQRMKNKEIKGMDYLIEPIF